MTTSTQTAPQEGTPERAAYDEGYDLARGLVRAVPTADDGTLSFYGYAQKDADGDNRDPNDAAEAWGLTAAIGEDWDWDALSDELDAFNDGFRAGLEARVEANLAAADEDED